MEGETESVVGNIIALTAVEEILLQIVTDGEERAAGRVRSTVDAIRAQRTLDGRTCAGDQLCLSLALKSWD